MTEEQRQLAEDNMALVHYILHRKIRPRPFEYEDCSQEGMLGLCIAAVKFDPSRGVEFSTYAGVWIEGLIRRYRRDNTLLHEPRSLKDNFYRIQVYKSVHGEDCDESEMLEQLGLSVWDYQDIIAAREIADLDHQISLKDGSASFIEMIPDRSYEDRVKYEQEEKLLIELENELVSKQVPRVRDIYDDYFYSHLFGDKIGQNDLAKKYGCSQARVSRIISRLNRELIEEYRRCM